MGSIADIKRRVPMSLLLEALGTSFADWRTRTSNPLGESFHSVSCPFCDEGSFPARYSDDTGTGSGYFECFSCHVKGDQLTILVDGLKLKSWKHAISWINRNVLDLRTTRIKGRLQWVPRRPPDWVPPDGWCEGDEITDHDWVKPWPDAWGHPKDGGWTEHQEWWDLAVTRWWAAALGSFLPGEGQRGVVAGSRLDTIRDDVENTIRDAIVYALIRFNPDRSSFMTFLHRVVRSKVINLVEKEARVRHHEKLAHPRPSGNREIEEAHRARNARIPSPEHGWAANMDWKLQLGIVRLLLGPEHARLMWHLGTTGFGKSSKQGWTLREYAEKAGIGKTKVRRLHKEVLGLLEEERIIGHEVPAFLRAHSEAS